MNSDQNLMAPNLTAVRHIRQSKCPTFLQQNPHHARAWTEGEYKKRTGFQVVSDRLSIALHHMQIAHELGFSDAERDEKLGGQACRPPTCVTLSFVTPYTRQDHSCFGSSMPL